MIFQGQFTTVSTLFSVKNKLCIGDISKSTKNLKLTLTVRNLTHMFYYSLIDTFKDILSFILSTRYQQFQKKAPQRAAHTVVAFLVLVPLQQQHHYPEPCWQGLDNTQIYWIRNSEHDLWGIFAEINFPEDYAMYIQYMKHCSSS